MVFGGYPTGFENRLSSGGRTRRLLHHIGLGGHFLWRLFACGA